MVLIGASGSGKTTLLRSIAALEVPDEGSIRVLDQELVFGQTRRLTEKELRAFRSEIGMVFQQYNLFPHMTVMENMLLAPIHVKRGRREEMEDLALKLLQKVGLGEMADRYPSQLSGGQQQRVAIARALAMQPALMLFDEVTSALDPQLVEEVERVIRNLVDTGMTMVLVTHELDFARAVADEIIFMENGLIAEAGPPSHILDNPQHESTDRFVRRARRETN